MEITEPAACIFTMSRVYEAKPTNPGQREVNRVGAGSKPALQHLETISGRDTVPTVL
jgi:hypothetical protein